MRETALGSRPAFDQLTARHMRASMSLAYRFVANRQDAEDIVQDVFFQVWISAAEWRGEKTRFTTWVYRIIVNRCLDHQRRRQNGVPPGGWPAVEPTPDAQAGIETKEQQEYLKGAVAALPPRQRTAVILCYYDDQTRAAAAEILGVSESALESLLVRAR